MKVAITYLNEEVFQHFGKSEAFKFYEIENKKVVSSEVVSTNGQGHGALAHFLKDHNVDVVICGGIGGGAKTALGNVGIEIYAGASGSCDRNVEIFLDGKLSKNSHTECDHHHEHEHDCNHDCGEIHMTLTRK